MPCEEKSKYRNEREALDVLRTVRKKPHGHGVRYLGVYRCSCGYWHLGRSQRSEREATGPILSASKLRRKVQAVGAQIAAEDRRILAEENRRAQMKAKHAAELAALAQEQADTMKWISEMLLSH